MRLYTKITIQAVAEAVEPGAQEYECEACGEPQVDGADELLMRHA